MLKKNCDGSYTYASNLDFTGTDSFSYTVSDSLFSTSATVSLLVASPAVNRRASITLQSSYGGSATPVENGGIAVSNQALQPAAAAFTLDWQGSVANQAVTSTDRYR